MTFAAEAAGYSFGAMGSHLIRLAAARHPVFGRSRQTSLFITKTSRKS
jgi:hypothetical protein